MSLVKFMFPRIGANESSIYNIFFTNIFLLSGRSLISKLRFYYSLSLKNYDIFIYFISGLDFSISNENILFPFCMIWSNDYIYIDGN